MNYADYAGASGTLKMIEGSRSATMDYNNAVGAGDGCLLGGFDLLYSGFVENVKTNRTRNLLIDLYNTSACQFKPTLAAEMGQQANPQVQQAQQVHQQDVYIPGKGKGKGNQNNNNANVNSNANRNNNNNPNVNINSANVNVPNVNINNIPNVNINNANQHGPIPQNPQPKHQPHPGPYGRRGGGKGK